jgi:Ser/Thr protein kinase RdoA (MazF antagonist)
VEAMKKTGKLFPVEASVLSQRAVEEMIKSEYFPKQSAVTCKLHYRSVHDTYIVFCNGGEYYFKVYRCGLRTEDEIQAEINLLLILRDSGIPAIEPVSKKDGEYVIRFELAEGRRYGVLYNAAGVKSVVTDCETDLFNIKLGRYIASIHNAWDKINYPVDRWHLDIDTFIDKSMEYIRIYRQWYVFDIDFLEEVARKTRERISNILMKEKPGCGICHGDIAGGNIRIDSNDNPVLIDFDFCGYGWRLYDVSVYLNAFSLGWEEMGIEKREQRREAFLVGYQGHTSLPDIELDNMYLFVPFRRIFNIGTLYISMSNTWGDNWVKTSLDEDIEMLKKWVDLSGF